MPMKRALLAPAAFLCAAALALGTAQWAAGAIEERSVAAVNSRLLADGITFADVSSDGLEVWLKGTAPNEAARFRAVNLAGSVVDAARIRDGLEVIPVRAIEAPRFSVEMLRNDDGISLIGLLPEAGGNAGLAEAAAALGQGLEVADMLETAAFPAPEGWDAALAYGLEALKLLPRSKISVAADRVAITAISDSESEKRRLEGELARKAPPGLTLAIDISAPRPVLTPFTLRFVRDEAGARFDACSADTDRARDRILAAGVAAGAEGRTPCTVGLGVPSPRWSEAAEAAIRAVAELGNASVTFSDADVSLLAGDDVPQEDFDRVIGELQTALPAVFSLAATLPPKAATVPQGPAEFTATLAEDGQVQLRGRLTDEMQRAAVDVYARAQFGAANVYIATRMDADLPEGWPVRVLAGLESLAQLTSGSLRVRADTVEITGVTGAQEARARIAQVLSDKLGQGQTFKVDVRYDEQLDPLAALPTPAECVADVNAALALQKISFAPGSVEIDASARETLDALAKVLGECPDVKFVVGGHTDSQGSEDGNRALSQARAEAVVLALQGRRVSVAGLTALGFGEARPVADNATEEGREANRRIEFTPVDLPVQAEAPARQSGGADGADATAEAEAVEPAAKEASGESAADAATEAPEADAPAADTPASDTPASETTGSETGQPYGAEAGAATEGDAPDADAAAPAAAAPDVAPALPDADQPVAGASDAAPESETADTSAEAPAAIAEGAPADEAPAEAATEATEAEATADTTATGAEGGTAPDATAEGAADAATADTAPEGTPGVAADDGPSFAPTENTVKPQRRPATD
ncbi:OmpA family protein [Fertoebacter nigrum]|uniref:OmpA family protein n=1 Tax=Fertoeibacter niger TaxID=2656921 RepID=A0A8X8H124_9RHOB|nr:OmpA family protein [Fertoeibacter niger]NUB44279.1 OmpA family protein [Fertoeibacter niger]